MRIFLFSILMLFLGQLAFNFAFSTLEDEEGISMNAEESEDGEGEEKIEFEKESTKTLTGHGSLSLYFHFAFSNEKNLVTRSMVLSYPKICVITPYCPPDRNC